jgi:hypothetical protein
MDTYRITVLRRDGLASPEPEFTNPKDAAREYVRTGKDQNVKLCELIRTDGLKTEVLFTHEKE